MRERNRFTHPDEVRYGVDPSDVAGQAKGASYTPPVRSGATPERPTPDRVRGTFETVATRTRKGRSTFRVTRRHARFVVGLDPVRETLGKADDGGMAFTTRGVRITGQTLADLADGWVRAFHPYALSEVHGGRRQCTCDDRTHTVVVLDRGDAYKPVYDRETGQYVTAEVPVRDCHCGFPRMLGTDFGLSYEQIGPGRGVHGADYLASYVGRDTVRKEARARRRRNPSTAHLSRAYGVTPRVPSGVLPTEVIASALAASDHPVVTITNIPGVRLVVRRPASGGAMTVRLTRNGASTTFRARTVARIARALVD